MEMEGIRHRRNRPERQLPIAEADPTNLKLIVDRVQHGDSTYLETFLDTSYKVGLTSFRIGKNGAIITSTLHKIATIMLWIVLSGLWGVHQWFNIHDTIRLRTVRFQAKAFFIVTTIMRAQFWYQLTNTKRFTKLLKIFKSERFSSLFLCKKNSNWFRFIHLTSLLSIIAICCSGLNVIPTKFLQKEEWRWDHVFLAHDYSLKRFFSGWLIKEEESCEIWPGSWSPTTVPLGLLGIILGLCAMTCDAFMIDVMLCSSLELLRTTANFSVKSDPPDVDIPLGIQYIKTAFMDMITAVYQVSTLSHKIKKTLLWSHVFNTMFWSIATAYGAHLVGKKDWAPAIVYATYTFKLLLHLLIRFTVSRKCKRFSKWVIYRIVEDYHDQNRGLRRRIPPGC